MTDNDGRISADRLEAFSTQVLTRVGVPADHAAITAAALVDADLCGLDSHGTAARLPAYVTRLNKGGTVANPNVQVVTESPVTAVVDADNGLGQVAARKGMDMAIERATATGLGLVAVRNSNHLGALGYWSAQAADNGLIGFSLSGVAARIAPWGSAERLLGTNPWALAFPAGDRPHVIIDMSMGIALLPALVAAKNKGEQIPQGWGLDVDGNPTTDPDAVIKGTILPVGGAKGASLTLGLEILGSILTGAAFGPNIPEVSEPQRPQSLGHLFLAIKVEALIPMDEYEQRLNEYLTMIVDSKPAAGFDSVRIPGQRREEIRRQRLDNGIPLGAKAQALKDLAETLELDSHPFGEAA